MKIFKFLTILALGANALSEREQRRQKRREEIERDGELGEEDAKVSSIGDFDNFLLENPHFFKLAKSPLHFHVIYNSNKICQ